MKYAKKVDASQAAIVRDLRLMGAQVIVLSHAGYDVPDLLVGVKGRWTLLEVKEKTGQLSRGQLTMLSEARGAVAVVTDTTEAQAAAFYCADLKNHQQDRIAIWLRQNPTQETLRIKSFFSVINGDK